MKICDTSFGITRASQITVYLPSGVSFADAADNKAPPGLSALIVTHTHTHTGSELFARVSTNFAKPRYQN